MVPGWVTAVVGLAGVLVTSFAAVLIHKYLMRNPGNPIKVKEAKEVTKPKDEVKEKTVKLKDEPKEKENNQDEEVKQQEASDDPPSVEAPETENYPSSKGGLINHPPLNIPDKRAPNYY